MYNLKIKNKMKPNNMNSKFERTNLKDKVRSHWEQETCGARYGFSGSRKKYFEEIKNTRYRLEPYLPLFANFHEARNKKILEIGVGAGVDFCQWVKNGAIATGIDLTARAIELTKERLAIDNAKNNNYELRVADAENLPFADNEFDVVYSWGVLHHTPDTERAFQEVYRVLKSGGVFKGMIYRVPSWVGWMMWILHCFLKGKPFRTAKDAIYDNLESPGTKAFTIQEARDLLNKVGFEYIKLNTKLSPGDLLLIQPSQKYQNSASKIIWKFYPRYLVKILGDKYGLSLLIEAIKTEVKK